MKCMHACIRTRVYTVHRTHRAPWTSMNFWRNPKLCVSESLLCAQWHERDRGTNYSTDRIVCRWRIALCMCCNIFSQLSTDPMYDHLLLKPLKTELSYRRPANQSASQTTDVSPIRLQFIAQTNKRQIQLKKYSIHFLPSYLGVWKSMVSVHPFVAALHAISTMILPKHPTHLTSPPS